MAAAASSPPTCASRPRAPSPRTSVRPPDAVMASLPVAAIAEPPPVQRNVGEIILALEGISLAFGGGKALTDISFDVRAHEIRAIIGPNGAGKSSMLNVINGVYRPQQGT